MAPGRPKVANDFNAMINADRQRRKDEALAQEIFGKGRRSSAPGNGNRKPGTGPSLASRIGNGITKRSTSTSTKPIGRNARTQNDRPVGGNVDAEWTHDLHAQNNPAASLSRPASKKLLRPGQANRLHSAIHGSASSPALNSQFNVVTPSRPGISIRGIAGPYVVMAKNFAHGTTAADIESAMTPVGGVALNCRLIAELPNVIAEITFETKEGADNVVHTFNNQSADGNILHVYHKIGGAAPRATLHRAGLAPSSAPTGPRANGTGQTYGNSASYPRERSRDRKQDYGSRADIIDGSYGFADRMDEDDRDGDSARPNLYSDTLINKRGRGHSRDRGRGNSRGYN